MTRHSTVHEIKTAIADVLRAVAPTAVVYERAILDSVDQKDWPARFRSDADTDSKGNPRTHGYMVEYLRSPASQRTLRGVQGPSDEIWEFVIFGLIKQRRDDASAEAVLTEIFDISAAFRFVPGAQALDEKLKYVEGYEDQYDTRPFGGEMCHYLLAKLTLRPC